ncbi:M3 family oligoendopeptidase [Paenibacillus aurantius]|uniref:M3 family oligoendopeptidase n=1 Tax=Paenibacillus aurantius TaxID=2918900 RepID=A0AA96LGG9_9BACL|nr:M3 family oligoendopeptidase [Paenibacillus aurantius]WNQ12588.1 M3 family oligoendopeptidase [Paenibacillus aurantius]
MKQPLNPTWELDSIFEGGSGSPAFASFLDEIAEETAAFSGRLDQAEELPEERRAEKIPALLGSLQTILKKLREAESFAGCLAAENQSDRRAVQLGGRIKGLSAAYQSALTRFDRLLTGLPEEAFRRLLEQPPASGVAFSLEERRALAKEKLPPEQESLVNDLAVDGYHGWGDLYDTTVSRMRIPYEDNGQTVELSAGQMYNKLHTPDREKRKQLFRQWEASWEEQADFCADALNHLAGFRLALYRNRGWDSVLKEPLAINRMSEKTLDAMWGAIARSKPVLVEYLQRKAKLLGTETLDWHDVEAPIGGSGREYSYDEGAALIVEQFRRFSPKMADFAELAFEKRWIEAEDRPGKRPGGFCTSFPVSGETRIFMTFGGTASNVSTLAHELGHAYHQYVMDDLPALAQEYAMNVAETASTFAEMIVSDAAIRQAGEEEKLGLLEDKIQRTVAFFLNIHARLLFETRFYEERRKGLVGTERLNELMVEAQKEAFSGALGEYHPHFWAAKLHFYATDVPFYNFPYTFGYLFSAGLYAQAVKEGEGFEDRYIALLRDTASMTVEELAKKHLGVDLEQPDFWDRAVGLCVEDIHQFLEMTK